MNGKRVFVGLDYHQSAVQVCVMDASSKVLLNVPRSNDWKKIVEAAERHGNVAEVAIEACTGAADLADEAGSGQDELFGCPVAGGSGTGGLSAASVAGTNGGSRARPQT